MNLTENFIFYQFKSKLIPTTMALFSLFSSPICHAASGTLDSSFGLGGIVSKDVAGSFDYAYSVLVQPDGKIVTAGYAINPNSGGSYDFALTRNNSDGSPDTTFGINGVVTTDISPAGFDYARSVTLQADGKLVVTGTSNGDFAIVRYNTNGSLDTTFSGDGKTTMDFGADDSAYSVVVQTDGKILVAGDIFITGTSSYDLALARFDTNGNLDTTFGGGDGKVTSGYGVLPSGANSANTTVLVQPDGKIILAGQAYNGTDYDLFMYRYEADGNNLDFTFGLGGQVFIDRITPSGLGSSVALQPDGKIVVAGSTLNGTYDFLLTRYDANGKIDITFDGDGRATTDFGAGDVVYGIVVQPDGKIVAVGHTFSPASGFDFAVSRYLANGSPDISFNGTGKTTIPIGASHDYADNVALQSDGQIIVTGAYDNGGNWDIAIARVNGSENTKPVITPEITGTLGANGWYISPVIVAWTITDVADPNPTLTGCNTVTIQTDTDGQTLTCSATDQAGNSASKSVTIKLDLTNPALGALPASSSIPATSANGAVVTYATPTATDNFGTPTVACLPASGNTFPIGTTKVTCSARDAAGNTASGSFNVTVTPLVASGPVAVNDTFSLRVKNGLGQSVTVAAPGVLNNDTSSNGVKKVAGITTRLPVRIIPFGLRGVVLLYADGRFSFTRGLGSPSSANYNFTYQMTDGVGTSNTATVNFSIQPPPP